jgi:hypothetical protein
MATETVAAATWHGTPGGYCNHACHCDKCKGSWNEYRRDRYAQLRDHGVLIPGWRDRLRENRSTGNA